MPIPRNSCDGWPPTISDALRARTKRFGFDAIRLVKQLPRGLAVDEVARQLQCELAPHVKLDALLTKARELRAIFAQSVRTARERDRPR